jgi:RNA recognition motif-containing protein
LSSAEAAQKAVDALDKKELDGRPVIVEVAKPADQKDKEKKEKKAKRRPGRRGGKPVPGEITEAEANGEAEKAEVAPLTDEAAKPKKKKKSSVSCNAVDIKRHTYTVHTAQVQAHIGWRCRNFCRCGSRPRC